MSTDDGTPADRVQQLMEELYEIVGYQALDGYELAGMTVIVHSDPSDDSQSTMAMPIFLFPEPPSLQRVYDAAGACNEMARLLSAQSN